MHEDKIELKFHWGCNLVGLVLLITSLVKTRNDLAFCECSVWILVFDVSSIILFSIMIYYGLFFRAIINQQGIMIFAPYPHLIRVIHSISWDDIEEVSSPSFFIGLEPFITVTGETRDKKFYFQISELMVNWKNALIYIAEHTPRNVIEKKVQKYIDRLKTKSQSDK
jgi:hypothetical protein